MPVHRFNSCLSLALAQVDAGVLPEQSATGDCSAEAELVVRLTQEALCAACVQPGAAVSWQGFKVVIEIVITVLL